MFKVTIEEFERVPDEMDFHPVHNIVRFAQTFDTLALPKVIAFLNAPTRKPRTKREPSK